MVNYVQLAMQFVLSGAIVVGATFIADKLDSKWSGLLVALPVMTILGFIFISLNTNGVITQRYLLSAFLFMIPTAIYVLSLYLFLGKVNLTGNILLSTIPFGIAVFVIQKLI